MTGTTKAARIVLVEDNPQDVFLLEKSLRARGIAYELTRYADGEQAIRAFSGERGTVPDLILLDLNLPRRDGFEVLTAIRNDPLLADVPVGIFTSSSAAQDRHRSAVLGARKYILKPHTLDEFIEQVGRAVEDLLAL